MRSLSAQPITDASCDILPFPTNRRVGKIRRTVEVLSDRSGKGADQYWKQVIAGMRTQMVSAGLADDVIERELRAFADEVFGRISHCPRPETNGAL
ncbi:DUF6074 family protein [Mesorhizobium sp. M7D.F.Ca.US.004.01.2.1]|uniref:DUF6074 family protein n=1 Tax=Mesorhizobium sp. M7D.F.Ca.US.004.01.2.1 TaxID=2496738 RepID=UPI000FCB493B|nr:DUF6074 family protein [Mesorhizobium sp. M7D.F.Ca.US.004.01.2.1]RUX97251.1 hypothetical protein EN993_04360 [Mesorhizobium sp. M7D.F.Ca.US.004.01.2.1]